MPKSESGWIVWGSRTLIIGLISYGIYLNKDKVSTQRFEDYTKAHEIWSQEVLRGLRYDVGEIKMSVRRIEDRLERKGNVGFIPGFPWFNFGTTNMGGVNIYGRR